jgi:hypothetical protein
VVLSCGFGCLGGYWKGWFPGVADDGLAQRGDDVGAVFAGGVDVGAYVESILGDVFAGESARDFLLRCGGPQVALADVVRGPDPRVEAETQHVVLPVAAELQQIPPG